MSPLFFYKSLADDTRLKILLLIALKEELCVCELVVALNLSQPKISRHLAQLRKGHLLTGERRGRWVYYKLDAKLPNWAHQVLQVTANASPNYFSASLNNLSTTNEFC